MSNDREILGYDCNGKPLRVGDRVEAVCDLPAFAPPGPWIVDGPHSWKPGAVVFLERDLEGDRFGGLCKVLRRIDDRTDHQPGEYTFDSLMDHLKSGVPA
ncbi:hypothetical protein ACLD0W_12760 [Alloalcanivorax sp. C16-1]|uniref:hypothetical protein n=1 Tax=Alloalcanivorax sp. C16-1 TaxID=3390051 RepID=UPI003970E348